MSPLDFLHAAWNGAAGPIWASLALTLLAGARLILAAAPPAKRTGRAFAPLAPLAAPRWTPATSGLIAIPAKAGIPFEALPRGKRRRLRRLSP